jgi:hypothetical protein
MLHWGQVKLLYQQGHQTKKKKSYLISLKGKALRFFIHFVWMDKHNLFAFVGGCLFIMDGLFHGKLPRLFTIFQ